MRMRRGRLIVVVVALVVLLALAAAVLLVRDMLSPQHFTRLLSQQAAKVGLQLHLQGPARPTVWPHLAVRLYGLQLRRRGYSESMLSARQVLLVVPWSSLLRGEPHIEKLIIRAPRVDVAEVQAWLADLDYAATSATPQLPTIGAGVHVVDGMVVKDNELLLKALQLDTGTLKSGKPFELHAQALTAEDYPLELRLQTRPVQTSASVRLDPARVFLAAGAPPALQLQGHLQWLGGLELRGVLAGELQMEDASYQVRVRWPEPGRPGDYGKMQVRLVGDSSRAELGLDPAQLLQWWQTTSSGGALKLPPMAGTVTADSIDIGALHVEGLRIQSSVPAPAASTTPASAASTAAPLGPAAAGSASSAAAAARPAADNTAGAEPAAASSS